MQSLETAVQSGALINLLELGLSNALTDDADVNEALLTTLLQSIASHCADLEYLDLSCNNFGLISSVVENISLRLRHVDLSATHPTTSFHPESQYTITCEMLNLYLKCLTSLYLTGSNFSGMARTLLLAMFLQAFQSLEKLICFDCCSLTSADIIMLIHHLKSANVVCKTLNRLYLNNNSIDDEGVMAFTECLPELFPRLNKFELKFQDGVILRGNPVSKELTLMCNEYLKVSIYIYLYIIMAFSLYHPVL